MTTNLLAKQAAVQSQRMAPAATRSPLLKVLNENSLRGKDILGIKELSTAEIELILEIAGLLKENKFDDTQTMFAKGQTLAMLFEKPSLRTRVTFEAGMIQLGGSAINIEQKLGERESVADISRNLDRWIDGIMARVFEHQSLVELADNAKIPVINGLSDIEHPCQALADFLTIKEYKSTFAGVKIAFIGDGNNVANSLALMAAKLGADFVIACPKGFEPSKAIWNAALEFAKESGAQLSITNSPTAAVENADVIYTDTWVSMGQESEAAHRAALFAPFQVNAALVAAAKPDAIVMHCMPAHRGQEITDEVMDGPQSVVFDQAENRLHAQKAVISLVM
jgi:ornithine carbamoyltransferase